MTMLELKPCPFCGKDAQIAPDEIGSGGQHVPPYHAGCLRGAGCGIAFTADDPDEAIAEWNRRTLAERAGGVKVSDILSIIALWSDDEGLDLSFGQGDDLARRILSTLTTEPATQEGRQEAGRGVVWFGYDENTGEFTGQSCAVKPYDSRGFRAYVPVTTRPRGSR